VTATKDYEVEARGRKMWLMLPAAHSSTHGSLPVSVGALEVKLVLLFEALTKCSSSILSC
jgi:hypothetical protein